MNQYVADRPKNRSALVLYGTETGNSQEVAEELGVVAERLHFVTQVSELDNFRPELLSAYTFTIFVVSTTGQGDLPANARTFWRSLLLKRLPPTFLSGVNFVSFGLGDTSYPKFNWASRKLNRRLLQLGATEIFPCGEADQQHPEGLEGTFIPWLTDFRKHLLDRYPLLPGQEPIPDDVPLPPKWLLQDKERVPATSSAGSIVPGTQELQLAPDEYPGLYRLDHDVRPMPDCFTATLAQNKRVTPPKHWQDVRHISLTAPDSASYGPGDILAITPKNFPDDVQALIDMMGWNDQADKLVSLVPGEGLSSADQIPSPPIPGLELHPKLTLRAFLTDYLDVRAIPRRAFFSIISHYTNNEMHKERLLEFTNPEFLDEFWDYTARPRRSVLEVLHEFDSIKIPWRHAPSVFPVLRARQFSIASGGELKRTADGGAKFELLIAIVKYRTIIRRIREGVCTRYLSVLRPGSTLKVQLQRGGLNPSATQLAGATLLVGPGTGVAPLRSMLWEKAALLRAYRQENPGVEPPIGPTILLYGGRNRVADFFFDEEWRYLGGLMPLQIITAFSRDQKEKIYVQDVIRQNSRLFFRLLHDLTGSVYICGSSGRMPEAVREALVQTFQHGGESTDEAFSREEAEEYMTEMEKIGRYKQETW